MTAAETTAPSPRPARRRREIRIAYAVWLLLLLLVTPFLLSGAIVMKRYLAAEREQHLTAVNDRVEALANAVDRRLRSTIDLAEAIAASPDLSAGDLEGFASWAGTLAEERSPGLVVLDPDGLELLNTAAPIPPGDRRAADAEIVAEVAASGEPAVGGLASQFGLEAPGLFVYVPVRGAGDVIGVLAYGVPVTALREIVEQTLRQPGWFASIVDGSSGRIVARSFRHEDFFGHPADPEFVASLTGQSGILESTDLEGRHVVTSYARSRASDFVYLVWVPQTILSEPQGRAIWLLLLVPGVTIVGSFAAALLASRVMLSPLRRLHRMAGEIAAGRSVRFEPSLMHEANVVGSALTRASAQLAESMSDLKARSRELQAANDKLNLALDAARSGAWELDLSSNRAIWSRENSVLLGVEPSDLPPDYREYIERHVLPADRERLSAEVAALVASRETDLAMEYRILHPRLGIRWIAASGKVERDEEGRALRLVGLNQDVTERKENEEHVRLLLREVNHRSKNMLAVVQAIARATAARDPAEFVDRFSHRVQALSASQDLLVRNEWRGVDIAELARAQLAHYGGYFGDRIRLSGEPLMIRPVAAQAIGMALHELGTNAGKYGALAGAAGTIEIAWSVTGAGEAARFAISWFERGGPPVAEPGRRGFGTTVVEMMSRRSLDADVVYDLGPEGVDWRLECAASAVVDKAA